MSRHIVEFNVKLDIEPEHDLAPQTDMEAHLRSDLTGIVVDHDHYMDEKFANRMRFSFAHELGHFFLHKDFYETVVFESAEEWKEILLGLPEADYTNFEYQANEFAGRLLVPREALIHEIENAGDASNENNMLDHIKSDPYAVLSAISTSNRQDIRSVIRCDRKTGGAGKTMATGCLEKKRTQRSEEDRG